MAESNRAREGRLREVVVELQASHAADLEMWTSAAHGDGPESTRRMADALGHWSQRVQQRLRGVRAHLVLDGSTDELELALALRDWMTRVEPRVCASATIGPDAVWRMPGLLQTAMPDALIRMCCDGIDPEIVICRSYPDS